jgi:hypothetical protein
LPAGNKLWIGAWGFEDWSLWSWSSDAENEFSWSFRTGLGFEIDDVVWCLVQWVGLGSGYLDHLAICAGCIFLLSVFVAKRVQCRTNVINK